MVLQILFIALVIEFLFSLYIFRGDFLSPAVIFNGVFVLASLNLMLMVDYWNLNLDWITLIIIITGTLSYTTTAIFLQSLESSWSFAVEEKIYYKEKTIDIGNNVLQVIVCAYFLVIILVMFSVVKSNGLGLSFASYFSVISTNEELNLPWITALLLKICTISGYVWCYVFANKWAMEKKMNKYLLVLIIEAMLMSLAMGKRGDLVSFVVVLVVFLIIELKKNKSKKLSRKIYFLSFFSLFALAMSFQTIATYMGRDSYLFNPLEYFSIYFGAPILNLDTSIRRGGFNHPVFLSETFYSLYKAIGENFNVQKFIYDSDRIFLSSPNGKRVGNVNTAFYDFYHDGGVFAVVILSSLMAVIAQYLYNKLKARRASNIMFITLVYGYVFWMTARSFFANSLFNWFTLSTIQTLFIWWILSLILQKRIKFNIN